MTIWTMASPVLGNTLAPTAAPSGVVPSGASGAVVALAAADEVVVARPAGQQIASAAADPTLPLGGKAVSVEHVGASQSLDAIPARPLCHTRAGKAVADDQFYPIWAPGQLVVSPADRPSPW